MNWFLHLESRGDEDCFGQNNKQEFSKKYLKPDSEEVLDQEKKPTRSRINEESNQYQFPKLEKIIKWQEKC